MQLQEYLRTRTGKEEGFEELIGLIHPGLEVRAFLKKGLEEIKAESGEKEWKDGKPEAGSRRALTRLKLIAYAWQYDVEKGTQIVESREAHSSASILQTLRTCFFSQGWAFELYDLLRRKGLHDQEFHELMRRMAQDILKLGERDGNNRAFFYALGHAYAAGQFPEVEEAELWLKYANAVFDDWYQTGDCYEPGYVAHNIAWVIRLGLVLGRRKELTSQRALLIYERYLNHISPGGLAIAPGDGDDQSAYLPSLGLIYELTGDKRYLWVVESVTAAGEYGGYRNKKEDRRQQPEQVVHKGTEPGGCTQVQYLYPDTLRVPDRILLNPSRHPGDPYLGMLINDRYDTLHHASEDNRGEIYHYEMGGELYLKRSSWYKWAELTNTLIMRDQTEEYPYTYSQGLLKNHWYHGSGDLRLLQHFIPDREYEMCFKSFEEFKHFKQAGDITQPYDMPLPLQYTKKSSPYGLFLCNPNGMAGRNTRIRMTDITLSIHTFTKEYWEEKESLDAAMAWYRDGNRRAAYSSEAVDMVIRNLHLAGPSGKYYLEDTYDLEQCLQMIYYPMNGERRLLGNEEKEEFLKIVHHEDKIEFHVHCPLGRLDLFFTGLEEEVDLQNGYRRLGFDYCYLSDVRDYLRTPVKIMANRITTRSLYVDHQQGGVFRTGRTEQRGKDCYGEVIFDGIYTYDTSWKRKTLLTGEGYLIVVDELEPGADAEGMAGGPVWQLGTAPMRGLQWADTGNFMVYCHPQRGHSYGVQCQPKIWVDREYAFYDRAILQEGRREVFVTVMIPHEAGIDPVQLCCKKNSGGCLEPEREGFKEGIRTNGREETEGIVTKIDSQDNVSVLLNSSCLKERLQAVLLQNGEWKVDRL